MEIDDECPPSHGGGPEEVHACFLAGGLLFLITTSIPGCLDVMSFLHELLYWKLTIFGEIFLKNKGSWNVILGNY